MSTKKHRRNLEADEAKTISKLVKELFESKYEIGIDTSNEPFAVPRNGARVAVPLGGEELKSAVALSYVETFDDTISASMIEQVLLAERGRARLCEPKDVPLRVVLLGKDEKIQILIDLGGPTGRVIEVTPKGWVILPSSPIPFRRTAATLPLVEPQRGGSINLLRPYLNVPDRSWPLIVGFIISAYFPDMPHPILGLIGEQGTAKSTLTRMLVKLIDPTRADTRYIADKLDDWVVAALASYLVPLDNISYISPKMSDAICRAVTGDSGMKRKLWTDYGVVIMEFRRLLIMNTIAFGPLRADLAERMMMVELKRIPKVARLPEISMMDDFMRDCPLIIGGFLDLLVEVLRVYPTVEPKYAHRMADFLKILSAIDNVRNLGAVSSFLDNAKRSSVTALESSVLTDPLLSWVRSHPTWTGTASDLEKGLKDRLPEKPPKRWPTDAARFAGELRTIAPDLARVHGIQVRIGERRTATKRIIEIEQTEMDLEETIETSSDAATCTPMAGVWEQVGGVFPNVLQQSPNVGAIEGRNRPDSLMLSENSAPVKTEDDLPLDFDPTEPF